MSDPPAPTPRDGGSGRRQRRDETPVTVPPVDPYSPPGYTYPYGVQPPPISGQPYQQPPGGYGLPTSGGQSPYGPVPASPYGAPPFATPSAQYYYAVPLAEEQREQCEAAVRRILTNELRSLPTKLAVANERLFDQYDRLSAEASLRLNLAPAFVVLAGLLAWRMSFWFGLGLVVPVLLVIQAMGKLRAANDLLIQSVVTQAIQSSEVLAAGRYVVEQSRTDQTREPGTVTGGRPQQPRPRLDDENPDG